MTANPCVLIPTFDNQRTLAEAVRSAAKHLPVLVVDDGSRDDTATILEALAAELTNLTVLTHARNQGKGKALATGFTHADSMGFTHAITMDSDGQHVAADIPAFLAAIEKKPATLWIGHRDLAAAGAGAGSKFGRWFSNFWTWVETGRRLPDTQCGYRSYPLAPILALQLDTTDYDYEVEVLVKASWTGVDLDSLPIRVRYFQGKDHVSHMRPIVDFMRVARLNTRLCTLRCSFPLPYLGKRSLKRFHALPLRERLRQSFTELFVREPGSPGRIAGSVALGLFMGIAPFWGFQIALTIVLAHLLGASKIIAVVASNVSFPLMIPPILYGSLVLGRLALGDDRRVADCWTLQIQPSDFWPWVLGSFILATLVAVAGSLLTLVLVRSVRRLKRRNSTA